MSSQKKKFQFRGKQILLLGLVALVISAGYYRWTVERERLSASVPAASDAVPANAEGGQNSDNNGNNNEENKDDNAGENTGGGTEEMSKLRQERDASRGQSVEEWKKIAGDSNTSQEGKKDAEKKVAQATDNAEKERKIETLVKAKGYADCFAYVDGGGVTVTVQGGQIDGSRVAQIKDIIISETNVPVKNIKINAI